MIGAIDDVLPVDVEQTAIAQVIRVRVRDPSRELVTRLVHFVEPERVQPRCELVHVPGAHTDNDTLVPTVDLDELVRQVRASVAWVHANARSCGGDPARITVSGHSAGGHLVAMLLATDWAQFGVPADVVKAGCAVSGLYDLEPIRLCYLNDVLGLTPESARRNSPVHLKPTGRAPLVLAVGAAEGPEYHRQTNDLAAAWRALGAPVDIVDAAGLDHFSVVAELERPDSALARVIRRQMALA